MTSRTQFRPALSARIVLFWGRFEDAVCPIDDMRDCAGGLARPRRVVVGFSPWTIAKMFEIDGYGESPIEARTMFDEWVDWERLKAGMAQEAMQGQEQAQPRGRPPSGNRPPRIVSKDGGTRSSVVTS
jgi:hypothetical protein